MNVYTLPLWAYKTNCYVVHGQNSTRCIVIDPGYEAGQILSFLEKKGLDLEAILLTHGHFDHVGGVKHIAQETGCPVYIHEADIQLPSRHTDGAIYHTHTYDEGDVLEIAGLQFQVLHTPGHTPGCVCLLCGDVMLSGDTLFAGTCGRTDIPPYGNPPQMRQSLARLKALEGDYGVFPGHGHSSTLEEERRTNPFMQGI